MATRSTRRTFLHRSATGAAGVGAAWGAVSSPLLSGLQPVSAAEATLDPAIVRFTPEIEPLVRLLEETPREQVLQAFATQVRQGTSYREILAALLLAGVRNVQPRPAVGFKFHAVLVVNAAHLASLSSPDEDRWLPIFWALDYFKSSQARDVQEGNWTMAPVDESAVPTADRAGEMFTQAMNDWDEPAADAAVASLARSAGAQEIFERFARFGARDFRSIGHKAIFVANSWRTLQCIGWQYAEPVLRSLAYALLNHEGDAHPATSDLAADRPWRDNQQLAQQIRAGWRQGKHDPSATRELLAAFRTHSPREASQQVVDMLNREVSVQSIYDALFLAAGEMLARQPGIVALHAVTSTNALHFAFRHAANDETRRMLLLQNAAFLPMFRDSMNSRGAVGEMELDQLEQTPVAADSEPVAQIFHDISHDRNLAARKLLAHLKSGADAADVMRMGRQLVFLKGTDAHDYKFSSAALEDYYQISPAWRDYFLASSVFQMRGADDPNNGLIDRIREAVG